MPKGLWKKIIDEVQTYFGYRLDWSVMVTLSVLSMAQFDLFVESFVTVHHACFEGQVLRFPGRQISWVIE